MSDKTLKRNLRINGALAADCHNAGFSLLRAIGIGIHNPLESGVKLSGVPGNPSMNMSVVPALDPFK